MRGITSSQTKVTDLGMKKERMRITATSAEGERRMLPGLISR